LCGARRADYTRSPYLRTSRFSAARSAPQNDLRAFFVIEVTSQYCPGAGRAQKFTRRSA
jgi:hypothetical protein